MSFLNRGIHLLRWFVRVRPVLWRALICWGLGCILLLSDEVNSLDLRFQLRGRQESASEVVIIDLKPQDFPTGTRLHGKLSSWKDIIELTDSFYWDPVVWKKLLNEVLGQSPRAVGVSLFFSNNLSRGNLTDQDLKLFHDPKLFWAQPNPGIERPSLPLFHPPHGLGSYELPRDEDGIVRRFPVNPNGAPHLAELLTQVDFPTGSSRLINYRGENNLWKQYSLQEVIDGKLPSHTFTNKIVLIGTDSGAGQQFLSPFGPSSRVNILANIIDNLLHYRWVKRSPTLFFAIPLFLLMAFCVYILISYPQTVAAVFLAWIATLIAALSFWVFDSFSIWIPIFSPLVQMLATWVVFLGYQANRFERKNMLLKQEHKSMQELEQLKNNFVSLISHDLKTPIAKGQAVVDRLLATSSTSPALSSDLHLLRSYNEELNRYIQSILKLLRVESRSFELTLELGDINETIERVVEQVKPLADQKNLRVTTELEPLFTLEGDFTLLHEVILNLLENAVKYTPENGTIHIRTSEEQEQIIVKIIDSGPGIPKDELGRVWQKFVRGKDHELSTSGTGLGLYLVKYFIELHGGHVSLESESGKGTTATVRLPLESIPHQKFAPQINGVVHG